MNSLRKYRHLVGFRPDKFGEQLNDFDQLQNLFSGAIPPAIQDFLISLSDCVLYYRYEAPTRSGKTKAYSHFVTTNIGPELDSYYPSPASLIGLVVAYRKGGLPDGYLPLMMDFEKTCWVWCNLSQGGSAVVVPRGERVFGGPDKEWNILAPSFDAFIEGLCLDLSEILRTFRVAGTGGVQPAFREWLEITVGEDWESTVQDLIKTKRRRKT